MDKFHLHSEAIPRLSGPVDLEKIRVLSASLIQTLTCVFKHYFVAHEHRNSGNETLNKIWGQLIIFLRFECVHFVSHVIFLAHSFVILKLIILFSHFWCIWVHDIWCYQDFSIFTFGALRYGIWCYIVRRNFSFSILVLWHMVTRLAELTCVRTLAVRETGHLDTIQLKIEQIGGNIYKRTQIQKTQIQMWIEKMEKLPQT